MAFYITAWHDNMFALIVPVKYIFIFDWNL